MKRRKRRHSEVSEVAVCDEDHSGTTLLSRIRVDNRTIRCVVLDIEGVLAERLAISTFLSRLHCESVLRWYFSQCWMSDEVQSSIRLLEKVTEDSSSRDKIIKYLLSNWKERPISKWTLPVHRIRQLMITFLASLSTNSSPFQPPKLFPEVLPTLRRWKKEGIAVFSFSSGAVVGYQNDFLLLSSEGNLLPYFEGHCSSPFWKEPAVVTLYEESETLFLSPDFVLAQSAVKRGFRVCIMRRSDCDLEDEERERKYPRVASLTFLWT